ncbi:ribonuclease HI family protein [Candidatus Dependentiae bacterium]|nr:MAG: ribonuclease HI family protein [Candidatus Dependentiae bacterium]
MLVDKTERQLFCFEKNQNENSSADIEKNIWHMFVDGAARKNPGPAGAGVFITKNHIAILKKGFFLGCKTNNQAEYIAFLLGIHHLKTFLKGQYAEITCYSDSLLMVKQLNGEYKVADQKLKKLYDIAKMYRDAIPMLIKHIPREKNMEADEAANWGIDNKVPLPKVFISTFSFE